MGKKLGLSSLFFRLRDTPRPSCRSPSPSPPSSWPWPSCKHPKTSSFREVEGDAAYKTVNSVYVESTESCFTRSSAEQESFSTVSDGSGGGSVETVVRGLRSDRLFFEPGGDTSSILEEAKGGVSPFEGSVVLAMESEDPYRDFRRSMEEMVAAHGLNDWERLEELLVWYLKVNGKKTHRFIAAAFVDLLVGLASPPPPPPSSFSSSSNSLKIEAIKEERSESS
ncbi:atofp18 ofp18 [Musa troglodytarum]|uniref:Transcription repressor n=1 Tax=Musa troglodytarum TaxID=320322 RepID=A0A9E7G096_9LILI|nr:atofp18 ofp18 [Musa troglodytarum]